jgi:uncharacterized coiled-coil protein SlyX
MELIVRRSGAGVTMARMPNQEMFEVQCPCCEATLKVDPETRAVISAKQKEQPKTVEDLASAVARVKSEPEKREEAFRKSLEQHRVQKDVLNKKFDELFQRAKENPDEPPPPRDIDFD